MISGVLLIIIVEEVSVPWAWVTYVTVSLLSLFVTYDKEAALIFIMFFGCYPMIRLALNNIPNKVLRLVIKLLFFNVCMIAYFRLTVYVFGMQGLLEAFEDFGKYGAMIVLCVLNPFFLMYDSSLTGMCLAYRKILKPRIMGKTQ